MVRVVQISVAALLFAGLAAAQTTNPSQVLPSSSPFVVRGSTPAPSTGCAYWLNGRLYSSGIDCGTGTGSTGTVFGRPLPVTALAGDYTTALVTESGSNVYLTPARVISAMAGLYVAPPASSVVDSTLVQFDTTTGRLVKALGLSGVLKVTAGVPAVVSGTPTDCVLVNGSSGACGGGGTAGPGMVTSGGIYSVDPLVVPFFATSAGTPSGTFAAGSLFVTDTTNGRPYWPIGANAFARLAKFSELPANMGGDSGSGGTAGLAPAPAAGDAAAGKFLKADGNWAVPPGSGGGSGSSPNGETTFTSQTSVSVTHSFAHAKIIVACYDGSNNLIEPSGIAIGSGPAYTATVAFTSAQTGRCVVNGGSGAKYAAAMSSATSWTVAGTTHLLGTCDVAVAVFDGSSPTKRVEPDSVTCDSTSKDVVIAFATAQAGRVTIQ